MSREASRKAFSIQATELLTYIPAWECHVHTCFSDGQASVLDCASRAYDLGLTRIIFTEHTEPGKVLEPSWFNQYVAAVREAAQVYSGSLEVLLGLEVPATDFKNGLELTQEMHNTADFILGTAHRYPGLEGRRVRDLPPKECIELEFQTLMALARNPDIDAIAHIGGTCGQYCTPFPRDLAWEVIRTATQSGIAIELNFRYHKPMAGMLELCIQAGARVTIGSDAHALKDIGAGFEALRASKPKVFL